MNPVELVTDRERFLILSGECEKIVNTDKRLPDFAFQRRFARYFAIEHARVATKEFGSFLSRMSNIFEDESVNYMTLQPHAVDYYYRNFSFFGMATFEPSSLVERYLPAMNRDRSVDSFLARGGDVGVFWGSSLKWGISCDRISWETAVIAVSDDIDVPAISGFPCMDASQLASYIESQYSGDSSIALNFERRFLANYSI
jgi:hypothetical protein